MRVVQAMQIDAAGGVDGMRGGEAIDEEEVMSSLMQGRVFVFLRGRHVPCHAIAAQGQSVTRS